MYDSYFYRFRRKYTQNRLLSITVSFSVFISLYILLNGLVNKFKILSNAWVYFLMLLIIFIISVAAYLYLFDFRIKRALIELEDIIYDYVDPLAFTEYLEATINYSKNRKVSPSLWLSYLKGLSYLGDKKKMREILENHGSILEGNLQIEAYNFNLLSHYHQKQEFEKYLSNMEKALKSEKQVKLIEIKGYMLNDEYQRANQLLDEVFDEDDDLISKVSWHLQKATVLIKMNQKDAARPHIQFVLDNGNTSYYVSEAKYLSQY